MLKEVFLLKLIFFVNKLPRTLTVKVRPETTKPSLGFIVGCNCNKVPRPYVLLQRPSQSSSFQQTSCLQNKLSAGTITLNPKEETLGLCESPRVEKSTYQTNKVRIDSTYHLYLTLISSVENNMYVCILRTIIVQVCFNS